VTPGAKPVSALEELPSRRSQVTDALRTAIISGELELGVTYSAPTLAEQLGVSATPVREAMMHLASEGLIDVVRNKGFRIVEPSARDLDEILEIRRLLEPPTAAKVAKAGVEPATLARLRKLADATVRTAKAADFSGNVAADIAFHVALIDLGGNAQLTEVVRGLRSRGRLFGLTSPHNADELLGTSREHGAIVDAIAAGDARRAEKLMRDHIARVRDAWAPDAGARA
jgi:DNA-binding GntR family transcriptional regulator